MIADLNKQIEQLISLYETQKQRADELAAKLAVQEADNAAKKQQIAELSAKVDHYKLAGAFTGSGNSSESKARIDKLVREIDKCIKLLDS